MSTENISTQNLTKEKFDWEVPIEAVPIPSRGAVYPATSSLCGKDLVEIKAMTAQEEDILSSQALIRQGTVITQLIRSCMIDKSVDVDQMLIGDRNALMISIRITGYGSSYKVDALCPSCSQKSSQDFDLGNLEIKRLKIDPVSKGENLFEFKLPVTGKTVQFKFLTGRDENERSTLLDRSKKITGGAGIERNITTKLEYHIISVEGISDRNAVSQFVSKMPARDSRSIRKYITENEPGMKMSVDMQCPHCGSVSEVALPIGANFFWPN